VREALFNILGNDLDGVSLLDATGGSGIIALEAASRGAGPVLVQDRDRRVVGALRATVRDMGFEGTIQARYGNSLQPGPDPQPFQLVFADPPYAHELEPWVEALLPRALEILVLEHAADKSAPEAPEGVELVTRRYGGSALSFYRRR
jgi:16S rRNA (guanine966-N2)-methyltransferase